MPIWLELTRIVSWKILIKIKILTSAIISMSSSRSSIKLLDWSKTVLQIPELCSELLMCPLICLWLAYSISHWMGALLTNKAREMIKLNINIVDVFLLQIRYWNNTNKISYWYQFSRCYFFILRGLNETLCCLKFCIVSVVLVPPLHNKGKSCPQILWWYALISLLTYHKVKTSQPLGTDILIINSFTANNINNNWSRL